VDWLWGEAETNHVPIMDRYLHATGSTWIDKVAERYPALRLTLSHLTLPMWKQDEEAFGNLHMLLALAKRPNVAVKASALPAVHQRTVSPYRRLHPHPAQSLPMRSVPGACSGSGTDLARIPSTYRTGGYHDDR